MSKHPRKQAQKHATTAPAKTAAALHWAAAHPLRIFVALAALASLRIAATYAVFNHTIDEPAHIACGMEWLQNHSYRLEPHHPPLARALVALGPYVAGARIQDGAEMYRNSPFHEGGLILYTGGRYSTYLTLARLAVLPLFWILAFAVYWWAKRSCGPLAAVLASLLLTFLPPLLAHAGLATNDVALTAFTVAAFVALLAFVEAPSPLRAAVLGAAAACAVLSKFTALAFLPVTFAAALAWHFAVGRPRANLRPLLVGFALALATALAAIWAAYRFSFGFSPALGMRVPAPELFDGIQGVMRLGKSGYPAYLLGAHSRTGWWYYYLVVLAVKTPLAFLALLFGGMALARRRFRDAAFALPVVFSASLLALSFFMRINTGVRYILPIYAGFAITAALGLSHLLESSGRWMRITGLVLLAWLCLSAALSHPDYIAYFNELAGDQPEKILADSDLDWGQDMNRVGKRLQELGVQQVAFQPFILADLSRHGWPPTTASDPLMPTAGWNAVSITVWKVARMGLIDREPNARLWPDYVRPRERVGKGILLYYFPPAPVTR